jgi:hypothetical protein
MALTKSSLQSNVQRLLKFLDYQAENGWLEADQFNEVGIHRFALKQAADEMNVVGVFAWVNTQTCTSLVAPLVYVAIAQDRIEPQKIHRKVWSQGLVPFLIILTPDEIIPRQGFQFSSTAWDKDIVSIAWDELMVPVPTKGPIADLWDFRALRIRTSLFWRDRAIEVSGRVDQYLLEGLESLSENLIDGRKLSHPLTPTAANGLIGRFLYLLFLADRGIISQQWLNTRGHAGIKLDSSSPEWSASSTWALFEDLDGIFNGSIFPLSPENREQIDTTHINLIRLVMRHGARVQADGAVQLAFIDVDLGVMRIETLSAVYEQFLENNKSGERRKQGAFYTPPFLVDLILDRVEETITLQDGVTILDPAAGSGVFLVGAYRRILEHALAGSPEKNMDLDEVRGLLQRNIFGIERNTDACHVAAFSLYLTMLDYVRPRDLVKVAAGHDSKKLFPSLVGMNLFAVDFFSSSALMPTLPKKIQCVIGNPPWQTLKKLESVPAAQWAAHHPDSPIGNDQAAELFVWKALRVHMAKGAFLALLIPAKSFVNPTAYKFRKQMLAEFSVVGAINFSHLRHRLFAGAKHACAALFVVHKSPAARDPVWVYSPLSIGQPMPLKAWPWTFIVDRSEVQQFQHSRLAENSRSWFEAFMLRPVDRQIRSLIDDRAKAGHIQLLGSLCTNIGAVVKRGGSSVETGLESKYLEANAVSFSRSSTGASTRKRDTSDLFEDVIQVSETSDHLPLVQLAKVSPTYLKQFSGHILLVPRNFQNVRYIDYPKAFSSSYLAVYFDKLGETTTPQERKFLAGLEKYFGSSTAHYFMATGGRRWLMDRSNVEPTDLQNFPVPFRNLNDPRLNSILELEGVQLEEFLMESFGIEADYKLAIKEFLEFRIHFQDGDVPSMALSKPSDDMLAKYSAVMQLRLNHLMDRDSAFTVDHARDAKTGVGVITAQFAESGKKVSKDSTLCTDAVRAYNRLAGNSFSDSLCMAYDPQKVAVSMVKPLEYFRWTIDSAYADSRKLMDTFIKGAA